MEEAAMSLKQWEKKVLEDRVRPPERVDALRLAAGLTAQRPQERVHCPRVRFDRLCMIPEPDHAPRPYWTRLG
jgi:hypothetical protein